MDVASQALLEKLQRKKKIMSNVEVSKGGDRAVKGGDRAVKGGDRAVKGGERAVKGGDRVVKGDDRVVKGGDRTVKGGDRAVKGGDRVVKGGDRAVKGEERAVKGDEEWLLKYFPSSALLPIDKIKSETGLACIMDSPEVHIHRRGLSPESYGSIIRCIMSGIWSSYQRRDYDSQRERGRQDQGIRSYHPRAS